MGDASKLRSDGSDRGEARFRCASCGQVVEAREATAYAAMRTDLQRFELGAKLLAEGLRIRASARILAMDKDTVCQWVAQLGKHCAQVAAYHFRNLQLTECQLDELWTFVRKKDAQLTPLEQMLNLYGDIWIWIAFAPVPKLVPAWVAGKRRLQESKTLIQCLKNRLDGHVPVFTSDDLPHYADALLDVYGQTLVPARSGQPGRPRQPYKVPPDDLLYAVVCKRREGSRVVAVTTQIIYGTAQKMAQALKRSPLSHPIST